MVQLQDIVTYFVKKSLVNSTTAFPNLDLYRPYSFLLSN
uniref:Uncharacterized protein n=1 Tax=Rhizophora mucronata TaxID=61149 RepID=A0A2P2P3M8_RHIMU